MKYPVGIDRNLNNPASSALAKTAARPDAPLRQNWPSRIAVALAFAILFMLVGWRELNPFAFPDLENYRLGFESEWYLFTIQNLGIIEFVLSEGLWVRSFDALASYVGDTEVAFGIVSFMSIFLIAWYVVSETRSPLYLLALVNPSFINLVLEQLRSGIATGIFLLAVRARNFFACLALCVLASSIHTVFWLLGGVLLAYRLVGSAPAYQQLMSRPMMGGFVIVVAGIAIGFLRNAALALIGDQRAFIQEQYTSGLLLSFAWLLFGGWFAYHLKSRLRGFEPMFLLFCSTLALVSAYQGLYASRFFAIGATMLPVLLFRIPAHVRLLTVVSYAIFVGIWFSLWLQ